LAHGPAESDIAHMATLMCFCWLAICSVEHKSSCKWSILYSQCICNVAFCRILHEL